MWKLSLVPNKYFENYSNYPFSGEKGAYLHVKPQKFCHYSCLKTHPSLWEQFTSLRSIYMVAPSCWDRVWLLCWSQEKTWTLLTTWLSLPPKKPTPPTSQQRKSKKDQRPRLFLSPKSQFILSDSSSQIYFSSGFQPSLGFEPLVIDTRQINDL